jgi:S-adenosyl-L-methionine hydrolase (adenosine-forming)
MITLTTDFGLSDHFVGAMKGVIAALAPRTQVVDVTHLVQRFSILDGAFTIAETYTYWPKKTIHVVVVDPGVGTSRRPILVEAAGQYFVGPDNGVFSWIYAREPKHKVRAITNEKLFLPGHSRTFHGRDIFAPVAAHLSLKITPAQVGKLVTDPVHLSNLMPQRSGKRVWTGSVLRVDHFGNLITNFHSRDFPGITTQPFEMLVGIQTVRRLALNYQEGNIGDVFVIVGSSGYLEVSSSQASAAQILGCGAQAPVELTLW